VETGIWIWISSVPSLFVDFPKKNKKKKKKKKKKGRKGRGGKRSTLTSQVLSMS